MTDKDKKFFLKYMKKLGEAFGKVSWNVWVKACKEEQKQKEG